MPLILPVLDTADSSYVISLEGSRYKIRTRWNTRTQNWYLSLEDSDENVITRFEKILPRVPLINYNLELFTGGNIYAISNTEDNKITINRDNLGSGKEYQLKYYTEEELN